ncbi:MAG TPA: helix-turn-helix domain-containing protein [Anaerolineae bacterium]|nr:helix-turn-helix domain-containing protein [Anaerolineae bacterium]
MAHPGVTLRREHIMTDVWDEHWWGSTRTLDTHVASLRRKLGDQGDPPEVITTVRGVGLRFEVG